jgi:ParB-like chromosome segregation protein Spo0J
MNTIRNRIVGHVTARAGDLVPHPLNYREHPEAQRQGLVASFEEIGFARSLLGYRRPDGRIQLIDGHLRAEYDPDMEVTVELLDVTDEEAAKLLLTLDPLAALATTNQETHAALEATVATAGAALRGLWQATAAAKRRLEGLRPPPTAPPAPPQFLILVECADEEEQAERLRFLTDHAIPCKALVS